MSDVERVDMIEKVRIRETNPMKISIVIRCGNDETYVLKDYWKERLGVKKDDSIRENMA